MSSVFKIEATSSDKVDSHSHANLAMTSGQEVWGKQDKTGVVIKIIIITIIIIIIKMIIIKK